MNDALTSLLELHAQIERELDARFAEIVAQEAEAQRIIGKCFERRQMLDRERAGLKDAERIYRDAFSLGDNSPSGTKAVVAVHTTAPCVSATGVAGAPEHGDQGSALGKQVRARIGPQRFLMFDAIYTMGSLSLDDIASLTKMNVKRVKNQMASDLKLGMVQQSGGNFAFTLTTAGMDLLERYKAYKRSQGQRLPTADDHPQEDDRDELDPDDLEGDSMAYAHASPAE